MQKCILCIASKCDYNCQVCSKVEVSVQWQQSGSEVVNTLSRITSNSIAVTVMLTH